MKRIRIGKDISMRWEITTDGVAIPLDGRDLTVEIKSPTGIENNIPYRIDGNILIMTYYGYEQKRTGEYSITLWEKKGKIGQNVVDVIRAFELVRTSQEENDFVGGDLQIESVDLGTGNFDILTEGGYRAINIDTLQAEALEDSVNIKGKTYSNESFTITLPKANLDSAGVMSADDKHTLQEHGNRIAQINTTLEEHTESINARITTDRIADGAVTSEKIATSAFDDTLSKRGKIAPADVVGERLIILEEEISHTANVTEESISVEDIYDGLSPKLIFAPNKNISSGGFPDSDIYDSFYFILPNDGKLYVPKMGGTTWMRIAIFGGSLTSHTDYIYKDSTAPDFPNTVDNALAGKEGQYVVISLNKDVKNFNLAYSYAKIEKTLDESIYIPAIINNKVFGKSPIIIKIVNSESFEVSVLNTNTGKYLTYTFKKHNYNVTIDGKSYIGGDVWNNYEVLNETGNSIAQGNLNFIYTIDGRVPGFEKEGDLHIGSGHGCEVADYTIFLADGKPFTPSNPEVIECSTFRAIWKSKCYAVDNTFATGNSNNYPKIVNGNKILAAEHYLNAEFKADNIIDWSNKLVVRRNGTVFNALYGGMVQGYSPYFSDVIINDETASWESWTSDGTVSHKYGLGIYDKKIKGDEVTMWGNGYVIKQKMIQEQANLNGHSYLFTNLYLSPIRTKVYMIPAKVSLLGSVGSADIFNNGDEINIRLVRKIEIVE